MVQSALARSLRQGCTGLPPPLTPVLHRAAAKVGFVISQNFHEIFNFVFRVIFLEFCENQNYFKIIVNFTKLEENFKKHEIKDFAR